MIQRIQSAYLLLGAGALVAVPFLDIISSGAAAQAYGWYRPVITALDIVIVVSLFASILLFRNRSLQVRIVSLIQLGIIVLAAGTYGGLYLAGSLQLVDSGADRGAVWTAVVLPVVAYVAIALARRAIQKDIALVRSMDRLRD
jgi:hypothetical protein